MSDQHIFLNDITISSLTEINKLNTLRVKSFTCNRLNITDLLGGPLEIVDTMVINNCYQLKSLKGCVDSVKEFTLQNCESIDNIKNGPTHVNMYRLDFCPNLKSLKGAPQKTKTFTCTHLPIRTLKHCPRYIKHVLSAYDCNELEYLNCEVEYTKELALSRCRNIKSFNNAWKHIKSCRIIYLFENDTTNGLIDLMRISDLTQIHSDNAAHTLLSTFLPVKSMSSIMQCQIQLKQTFPDINL